MPAKVTTEPVNTPTVEVQTNPIPTPPGVNLENKFRCPNCGGTKFHRPEHYGEIVNGQWVQTDIEYRCVFCHKTFSEEQVGLVKVRG
jgi:DNA-directed RNA polymerase subunit RPC12/RpoP